MIKIGDKVRFLNAVGGGIVRKFINKELVSVEEDDGFETPVLLKEIVVIAPAAEVAAQGKGGTGAVSKIQLDMDKPVHVRETAEGERLNLSLAYLADDDPNKLHTTYDCYLINECNYWVLFTYLCKVGANWKTCFVGMIEPNQKLHLEGFRRDDLNNRERVCVQMSAFKRNRDFELKQPISIEIKLDTVKFYKLNSFRETDHFTQPALIYPLIKSDLPYKPIQMSIGELEKAIKEKKVDGSAPIEALKRKYAMRNGVLEVDLHIEELLDDTSGMGNGEILSFQLDFFHKVLHEHRDNRGQKIVFIHGKGDGVLRSALLKELKSKYTKYYVQDASFREYGFGATMVTIR